MNGIRLRKSNSAPRIIADKRIADSHSAKASSTCDSRIIREESFLVPTTPACPLRGKRPPAPEKVTGPPSFIYPTFSSYQHHCKMRMLRRLVSHFKKKRPSDAHLSEEPTEMTTKHTRRYQPTFVSRILRQNLLRSSL